MKNVCKILILTMILVPLIVGCGCDKKKENDKKNGEKENNLVVLDDQIIEGLKISGFNIVYDSKKNESLIVGNVLNTTTKAVKLKMIDIYLYNKDNKLVIQTSGYVGTNVKANENKIIETAVTLDLTTVTKVVYKIRK